MNNPVETARARLVALEQEAEKLKAFIAAWDDVAAILGGAETPSTAATQSVEKGAAPEQPPRQRAVNPPSGVIIPAVIDILKTRGHPLSRRGLYVALRERGLVIQGSDPVKALGTILWRANNDVVQLEGYGYWPKAMPYPRAKYEGTPPDRGPVAPAVNPFI